MRRCLQKLVEEGLEIQDFEESYRALLRMNENASSSKEALTTFVWNLGFSPEKVHLASLELHSPLPQDFFIQKMEGADEIISWCKEKGRIAIVTAGASPSFQKEKIEKAGLDSSLFSKIAISDHLGKGVVYQQLLEEFSLLPEQVWVCGDRVDADLRPAKELGCHTIHMKWGRGRNGGANWIDFTIQSLKELKGIIQ